MSTIPAKKTELPAEVAPAWWQRLLLGTRLGRGAGTLAILLAVYSVYVLVITPMVEPPLSRADSGSSSSSGLGTLRLGDQYRQRFASLFAEDAWEVSGKPKVLESDGFVLLLQDYQPLGGDRLEIKPCTLIAEVGGNAEEAPRQIVLQAPEGAVLTFDRDIDLSRATIGRLQSGVLQGPISIRAPETTPGAGDQLLVTTRNMQIDPQRVWTPHEVSLRYGPHVAQGRDLIITLGQTDSSRSTRSSPLPAASAVQSVELVHLDRLRLHTAGHDLFGGLAAGSADTASSEDSSANASQWLELSCQGPMYLDLDRQIATFEKQVDLIRLKESGPSDQLACELLSLHFQTEEPPDSSLPNQPSPEGTTPAEDSPQQPFALRSIVAEGFPLLLRASSIEATVRSDRLSYDLVERQAIVTSQTEAILTYRQNEIRSKQVHYQMTDDSRIGRILATGPGSFQGASDGESPPLLARWEEELRVRPHDDVQVLSLVAGARVESPSTGMIQADELHLWFRETAPAVAVATQAPASPAITALPENPRPSQPSTPVGESSQLQPDRMMAQGNVRIDSTQMAGRAGRLELWFQFEQEAVPSSDTVPITHDSPPESESPARPPSSSMADAVGTPPGRKYQVSGDLVRALILQRNDITSVENITIQGNVELVELVPDSPHTRNGEGLPNHQPGDQPLATSPLTVTGDVLQVRQADANSGTFYINGTPAKVSVQGMTTLASNIQVDRLANRMWIVGPGEMTAPLHRDLSGELLATPQLATISWEGGVDFNGQLARIGETIRITTANQTATANGLDVLLNQRIDFANPEQRTGPIELQRVTLEDQVHLENRTYEAGQLAAVDRAEAARMTVDLSSGRLHSDGPGWISTIRRGGSSLLTGREAAPPASPNGSSLSFLKIEFARSAEGNHLGREMTFHEQVRAVYGEVTDWGQTLATSPLEQPVAGAFYLSADQAAAYEMGTHPSGRPAFELEATGRAIVENHPMTARAHRIRFSEDKDRLVLEGDGRADAEFFYQRTPGAAVSQFVARKILYWRGTGRVESDGIKILDLQQLGGFGQ